MVCEGAFGLESACFLSMLMFLLSSALEFLILKGVDLSYMMEVVMRIMAYPAKQPSVMKGMAG